MSFDIVPRRRDIVPRRLQDQLDKQLRYRHYEHKPDDSWTSYASQRHVRDIAFDRARNRIWLATWGGVLCIEGTYATRHTSAHGLIGNATRFIVVDDAGVVWAAPEAGGLCSLRPDEIWETHDKLRSWTVSQMAIGTQGDVYAALGNHSGQYALHHIAGGKVKKPKPVRGQLALKEVDAMLVDRGGVVWLGNVWGLHRYNEGKFETFDTDRAHVCALATSAGGGLWVGTNRGLYRFRTEDQSLHSESDWPRDPIVSLAEEPSSGILWAATTREVGRIVNNAWQPVLKSPSDRLNILRVAEHSDQPETRPFRVGHAWLGGGNELYHVGPDDFEAVLTPHAEDALSNAVHALCTNGSTMWMGTARGVSSYDGRSWTNHTALQPRDVRALSADQNGLWIAAWSAGLYRMDNGQYLPEQPLHLPLVSLSTGADGSLWAATVDNIFYRAADDGDWCELGSALQTQLGERSIQVICYQSPLLLIGTSAGLLRYSPEQKDPWTLKLDQLSIQSLAIDPSTNKLWIGTAEGLFSEPDCERHTTTDVRTIAFGPAPENELLLGLVDHFECWPSPGNGEVFAGSPLVSFSAKDAGLAADTVTALTVRVADNQQREIWIGSPNGVSSYRYSSEEISQNGRNRRH